MRLMNLLIPSIPTIPRSPLRRNNLKFLSRSQSPSSSSRGGNNTRKWEEELMPNARRREKDPLWTDGGFSLGVDLGNARTGLALGRGLAFARPLTVLEMRGVQLETKLIELALDENADELIIGFPKSYDGTETMQSKKTRFFVKSFAIKAAERGLRVYMQNEHGTSKDALDHMIKIGVRKSARRVQSDAYSAVMLLERYFEVSGYEAELVLPKQFELRKKLREKMKKEESLSDVDGYEKDFFSQL